MTQVRVKNDLNSLPNIKILDVTKLKAFADNKLNVAKMTICLFDRVENIVGKGENTGYQHFLFFPQCFPKSSSVGLLKVGIVWCRVKDKKLLKTLWERETMQVTSFFSSFHNVLCTD